MFSIDYAITPDDLESRYHHVHHAGALAILELGRLRLLDKIGFPNDQMIENGLFLVVTKIVVQYKRELREGSYTITCEEPTIVEKALSLKQRILDGRGKVAVEAVIEFKCMSAETRRAIEPPAEFAAQFLAPL